MNSKKTVPYIISHITFLEWVLGASAISLILKLSGSEFKEIDSIYFISLFVVYFVSECIVLILSKYGVKNIVSIPVNFVIPFVVLILLYIFQIQLFYYSIDIIIVIGLLWGLFSPKGSSSNSNSREKRNNTKSTNIKSTTIYSKEDHYTTWLENGTSGKGYTAEESQNSARVEWDRKNK